MPQTYSSFSTPFSRFEQPRAIPVYLSYISFMNRYLKMLLQVGITAGVLMGIVYALGYGLSGMITGLLAGLVFGGLFTLVIWLVDRATAPTLVPGSVPYSGNTKQFRKVVAAIDYETAFDLCRNSLADIEAHIDFEDRRSGLISAKTGTSMKSFGEAITCRIGVLDAQRVMVEVGSRPVLRSALIDFGKSYDNVETMIRFLASHTPVTVHTDPGIKRV